jgi:hypothetical protein
MVRVPIITYGGFVQITDQSKRHDVVILFSRQNVIGVISCCWGLMGEAARLVSLRLSHPGRETDVALGMVVGKSVLHEGLRRTPRLEKHELLNLRECPGYHQSVWAAGTRTRV